VVLGHTPQDHHGEIAVCTVDRAAFAEFNIHSHRNERADLAWSGLFTLLNRTSPALDEPERRQYGAAVDDFAGDEAASVAGWPELEWTISGDSHAIRMYSFVGAWLALCEEPMFFALGDGVRPETVTLTTDLPGRVANELAAGVDLDWLNAHRFIEPSHSGFELPRAVHPDHYRVLHPGAKAG
jgi:hypothetical protein